MGLETTPGTVSPDGHYIWTGSEWAGNVPHAAVIAANPPPGWYGDPDRHGGQRYFDGTAWTEHRTEPQRPSIPLAPPKLPQTEETIARRKRRRKRGWVIAGSIVALIVAGLSIPSLIGALQSPQQRYLSVRSSRDADLAADAVLIAKNCDGTNSDGCVTAASGMNYDSTRYLADLNAVALPPQSAKSDALMRQALDQFIQGTNLAMKGIGDNSASEIQSGTDMMQAGHDLVAQSKAALPS